MVLVISCLGGVCEGELFKVGEDERVDSGIGSKSVQNRSKEADVSF